MLMKLYIASDHAGFEQKEQLFEWLKNIGYDIENLGPDSDDRVDYPDFAEKVCRQVSDNAESFGILVCGTGIGMQIAANKIDGIRAANIVLPDFSKLSREHNNANVITLSGRFVDLDTNKQILDVFLNTDFAGGRHEMRVKKIMELEK